MLGQKSRQLGNFSRVHLESENRWEFLYGGKMGTILLVYVRDAHSKWGKFFTFSSDLPSDQRHEFRRSQVWCSVLLFAISQPHPHAHNHRILTNIQAGSEQAVRQKRERINYLDVIKQSLYFSGLMKSLKMFHIF